MTVEELITQLQQMPKHLQVIIQKDAEGNDYSPLYDTDQFAAYTPKNTWSGTVKPVEDPDLANCCVLVPVN